MNAKCFFTISQSSTRAQNKRYLILSEAIQWTRNLQLATRNFSSSQLATRNSQNSRLLCRWSVKNKLTLDCSRYISKSLVGDTSCCNFYLYLKFLNVDTVMKFFESLRKWSNDALFVKNVVWSSKLFLLEIQ